MVFLTAYNSYFKWRKFITFKDRPLHFRPFDLTIFCEMCIKLQLESHFGIDKSYIGDLENYWRGNSVCSDPSKHSILN